MWPSAANTKTITRFDVDQWEKQLDAAYQIIERFSSTRPRNHPKILEYNKLVQETSASLGEAKDHLDKGVNKQHILPNPKAKPGHAISRQFTDESCKSINEDRDIFENGSEHIILKDTEKMRRMGAKKHLGAFYEANPKLNSMESKVDLSAEKEGRVSVDMVVGGKRVGLDMGTLGELEKEWDIIEEEDEWDMCEASASLSLS